MMREESEATHTEENVADDATKWPGDEKRLLTESLWDYVKNSLFQGDD